MAELTDLTTLTLRDAYFVGLFTGCFFMCIFALLVSLANCLFELGEKLYKERKHDKA